MVNWVKKSLRLYRLLAFSLLLGAVLALCGCFDYEMELALTTPGEGSLSIRLILLQPLIKGFDVNPLDIIVFPKPQREMIKKGGLLMINEVCKFPNIDELAARRVLFNIKEIGTGLVGMTDYIYRVTAKMEMGEGDLPDLNVLPGTELEARQPNPAPTDKDTLRARELVSQSLAGHYFSMSFKLPGQATLARPLILGSSVVAPQVNDNLGIVTWRIPLSVLINENVRNTLLFSCDFRGRFNFRAYMQKEASSHYPDFFDEGLAEGKDMGERNPHRGRGKR